MDLGNLPTWAFALFFVSIGIFALNILARISGWTTLADYYGGNARLEGARKRFQSISMGRNALTMAHFNNIATLTVTPAAIELATFFPFDIASKPLVIPFSDLTATRAKRAFLFATVDLRTARASDVIIRFSQGQIDWIETERGAALTYDAAS